MSFARRSYKKELLDRDDIPFEDIQRNMQELNIINTRLGGHRISTDGIAALLQKVSIAREPGKAIVICEIGCGGGDNIDAIAYWCRATNTPVSFIGIDINPHCIRFAASKPRIAPVHFICADYREANLARQPDIIFSSLFCHHFTAAELIPQLQWMQQNARIGFFINDLHRHPLAYYSIKFITAIFSRSYLVKNDAPLSVKRGFTKKEWTQLLHEARIISYKIKWKWAFRFLITVSTHHE
jgi:2-polyprenyl-3-methyl-5-hydroxy-6-metoxy-1,4-benzoquinol methylase